VNAAKPIFNEGKHAAHIQLLVKRGILPEIGAGQFEESRGGTRAVFLQVNEGASQLNESFVEVSIGPVAIGQPEFLQNFMSLEEELPIEAFEEAEIVRVQMLPAARVDERLDAGRLFAHSQGAGMVELISLQRFTESR
jgi:hypothetical protein